MGQNVETVVVVETGQANRVVLDVEEGLVVIGGHQLEQQGGRVVGVYRGVVDKGPLDVEVSCWLFVVHSQLSSEGGVGGGREGDGVQVGGHLVLVVTLEHEDGSRQGLGA
jgi:hypothetical protein